MNGYDSDIAPELLLRSGKRTTEPALSRRWRLLQASTKLKCVKGACEIADLKQRLEERHNNNILVAKLRAFSSSLSDQRFQARSHNNPPAALDGASENCRAGKRGPCIACNLIDEKF